MTSSKGDDIVNAFNNMQQKLGRSLEKENRRDQRGRSRGKRGGAASAEAKLLLLREVAFGKLLSTPIPEDGGDAIWRKKTASASTGQNQVTCRPIGRQDTSANEENPAQAQL